MLKMFWVDSSKTFLIYIYGIQTAYFALCACLNVIIYENFQNKLIKFEIKGDIEQHSEHILVDGPV